jgi:hypothetical protein
VTVRTSSGHVLPARVSLTSFSATTPSASPHASSVTMTTTAGTTRMSLLIAVSNRRHFFREEEKPFFAVLRKSRKKLFQKFTFGQTLGFFDSLQLIVN